MVADCDAADSETVGSGLCVCTCVRRLAGANSQGRARARRWARGPEPQKQTSTMTSWSPTMGWLHRWEAGPDAAVAGAGPDDGLGGDLDRGMTVQTWRSRTSGCHRAEGKKIGSGTGTHRVAAPVADLVPAADVERPVPDGAAGGAEVRGLDFRRVEGDVAQHRVVPKSLPATASGERRADDERRRLLSLWKHGTVMPPPCLASPFARVGRHKYDAPPARSPKTVQCTLSREDPN